MSISDVGMLFQFIGGLGMFLYGMGEMADGLQRSAGHRMQRLLGVLTNNRLLGVLVGAAVTAIIQSSSATTVMVVGFVNAGIINLTQAVGIIMGANIGTTVTSWIVSMSEWGEALKPEFFAPLLFGIGAVMVLFMKNHKKKDAGEILIGFALLFIGLSFMSSSIKPYRDAEIFSTAFMVLGSNPILGILTGAVVTAIIQSSSASVGILQTLALNGIVNWQSAIFITLGQNIGTCVTALLSSIGASRTAKRAAVIHLLFNVVGAVIFGIVMFVLFSADAAWAQRTISSVEISVFHTVFNVVNTILLFPFAGLLVKASYLVVKEGKDEGEKALSVGEPQLKHLDDRILESPSFAIENVTNEMINMGHVVLDSLKSAASALMKNDSGEADKVLETETLINAYDKQHTAYLVKINNLSLNDEQHLQVKNLFYSIGDFERIGDHCENLAELAKSKIDKGLQFSDVAVEDMDRIFNTTVTAVERTISARKTMDLQDVRGVVKCEQEVDALEEELRERHIERLSDGRCQVDNGLVFLDAVSNLERISDHALNIAGYVRDEI